MWSYQVGNEGVSMEEMLVPMQKKAARKMAANLQSCYSGQYLCHLLMKERNLLLCRGILQPLLVFRGRIHRAIECSQPFIHAGVVMRMGNDDGFESTNR